MCCWSVMPSLCTSIVLNSVKLAECKSQVGEGFVVACGEGLGLLFHRHGKLLRNVVDLYRYTI